MFLCGFSIDVSRNLGQKASRSDTPPEPRSPGDALRVRNPNSPSSHSLRWAKARARHSRNKGYEPGCPVPLPGRAGPESFCAEILTDDLSSEGRQARRSFVIARIASLVAQILRSEPTRRGNEPSHLNCAPDRA